MINEPVFNQWKDHRYTRWRFAVYALARAETTLSLPAIGKLVGGRHHTTVLSGARRADPALVEQLRAKVIELRGQTP